MRHTFEERESIVRQILGGKPIFRICRELRLDRHMVYQWVLRYKKYGDEGLYEKRGVIRYTQEEKSEIVDLFVKEGVSLSELSLRYDVDRKTISEWSKRIFNNPRKENRRMARPKKKEPQTELEKLRAENERLRAENALLKKVRALVEERVARGQVTGRKPSRD